MSVFLLILGLLFFVGLVVVHELGHFLAARRNGVEVEEFGIGFPPRLKVLTKKKGTIYTLNLLPLGGFVRLKGEHDSAKGAGTYGAAPLKTKVKIMVAGVGMNLVTAFVLLTLAALIGMPKLIDNQFTVQNDTRIAKQQLLVAYVEPGSPADDAGLKQLDEITQLSARGEVVEFNEAEGFAGYTEQHAGDTIKIGYKRGGETFSTSVVLRPQNEVQASQDTDNPKGYLGVVPQEFATQRSTWSAPIVAGGLIGQFTVETIKGLSAALGALFSGEGAKASEQVAGPVGVFALMRDGSVIGPEFMLFLIAVISLTLAIMNILPIPALDGGRLFVTLVFRGIKKPLKKDTENLIHGTGFVLLMLLFVLITIVDVKRFF